ncbi:MAG: membrane-associated zinc metalloprotease [Parcubacteria group bacterium Gr01-1014_8]|nr:MAG: membrane-associated zinc metalloprotease [Parcubacteria group bacterium Gr01-1014_8]
MELFDSIFIIVIIMFSAVIHEVMHGVAADKLGDPTARYAGRLTLNPIKHLDPFGSVMLPVILALTHSPILFGWAKPVPYNPYNLTKSPKWGEAIVAGAGPASNFAIALIAAVFVRANFFSSELDSVLFLIVVINIMLGIFNLIPIPPLDGSKVLSALLPYGLARTYDELRARLEYNPFMGMGLVLIVILLLGGAFGNLVYSVARLLAGM